MDTDDAPASLFELAALNTPGDDVCDKVDLAAPTPTGAGYEDRNLPGAPEKATLFLDTPLLFELALLLARMLLFVIILLVASALLVASTFLVASLFLVAGSLVLLFVIAAGRLPGGTLIFRASSSVMLLLPADKLPDDKLPTELATLFFRAPLRSCRARLRRADLKHTRHNHVRTSSSCGGELFTKDRERISARFPKR